MSAPETQMGWMCPECTVIHAPNIEACHCVAQMELPENFDLTAAELTGVDQLLTGVDQLRNCAGEPAAVKA